MDLKNKWNVLKTEKDFKLTQEPNKIDWTSSSSDEDVPRNRPAKSSNKRKSNNKWKFKHEAKKLKFDESSDEIMKLIKSGSLEQELDEITLSPIQDTTRTPSPILYRTISPILNITNSPTSIMTSGSVISPILLTKNKTKRRTRNQRKTVEESLSLLNDVQVELEESKPSTEHPRPASPMLFKLEASEVMFTESLEDIIIEETESLISQHAKFKGEQTASLGRIPNQTSPVLLRLEPSEFMFKEAFNEVLIEESEGLISQQSKIQDQDTEVKGSFTRPDIEESDNLLQKIEEQFESSKEFSQKEIIVEETEDHATPIENSPEILTPSTVDATQISISVLSTQSSDDITILSPPLNTEAFVDFSQKNKHGVRKSKKRPPKIGSESYKLQELLRKQKSDVAFWRHERFLKVKSDIVDGALILTGFVQKFWKEYNKILILCKLETEDDVALVIINQELGKTLQDNVWLIIYPPYIRRKLLMNNICYDSLLNVNKIIVEKCFS